MVNFKSIKNQTLALPFPPLPPDFPIRFLSQATSEVLTRKKEKFIESVTIELECGFIYEGNLGYGKMNGFGKLFIKKKLKLREKSNKEKKLLLYEGQFEKNKVKGKGTLWFAGKEKFVGNFKDGLAHGYGEYFIRPDRIFVKGFWMEGILIK